jgi:hypothetical protein
MSRIIHSNPEILEHAVSDGINIFVRDVLVPRGFVDPTTYDADQEILLLRDEIARNVAQSWRTCRLNEEA